MLYEINYSKGNPDQDIIRLIDDLEVYPVHIKSIQARRGQLGIAYDIPEADLTWLKLRHPFITIHADV